ncbi:hypothetical protein GE09DRAFT_1127260 [Coniochaeta sp. 2T2.1]|nr:hypothetical protein GE09DRAFT_1127260 [Coniochaeta sp. 2T2.1]
MDPMHDALAQGVELKKSLDLLKTQFDSSQATYNEDQVHAQVELATATSQSMAALKAIAVLLRGELDHSHPPAGLKPSLQKCSEAWQTAGTDAGKCWDIVSKFSVNTAQFHDAQLGNWQTNAENLKSTLNAQLIATNASLQKENDTITSLVAHQGDLNGVLTSLQSKLADTQHQYDTAEEVTSWFPVAWLALQAIKAIIDSTSHAIEDTKEQITQTVDLITNSRQSIVDAQLHAAQLTDLIAQQAALASEETDLMARCQSLLGTVEAAQRDIAAVKDDRLRAEDLVARCAARADLASSELTKVNYGTMLLMVAEVAAADDTLRPAAADLVAELATHDDKADSIKGIKTDDHPGGLLAAVQAKLGPQGVSAGGSGSVPNPHPEDTAPADGSGGTGGSGLLTSLALMRAMAARMATPGALTAEQNAKAMLAIRSFRF